MDLHPSGRGNPLGDSTPTYFGLTILAKSTQVQIHPREIQKKNRPTLLSETVLESQTPIGGWSLAITAKSSWEKEALNYLRPFFLTGPETPK